MSNTHTAPDQPHVLIQRRGARTGYLHAAVRQGDTWRTACGETLQDGPRGLIVSWTGAAAHAILADPQQPVCRRCSRVGDTVQS